MNNRLIDRFGIPPGHFACGGIDQGVDGEPNLPNKPSIPGIRVSTAQFNVQRSMAGAPDTGDTSRQRQRTQLGDWLSAQVDSRYAVSHIAATDASGAHVLFDGYLSDIVGMAADDRSPAAAILALYHESGLDFLLRLRGSYTCLIVDGRRNCAHLFNDRRASRPLFYRQAGDASLLIGPEVALLAQAAPALHDIDPVAVCEFLLFASYYNDCTLFPTIRKLPPGSVMTLTPGALAVRPYWEIRIDPNKPPADETVLVEQGLALFNQSINRLMNATTQPFLFLSGGLDSRMILGGLRANGYRIPAVTYGTSEGDDAPIARQLAELCGLPFTYVPIETKDLQDHFVAASLNADCRAETIDSPTTEAMMPRLAEQFHTFLNGDITIMRRPASSHVDALDKAGVFTFAQSSRLADLLAPGAFRQVRTSINRTVNNILAGGRQLDPQDLMDKTYYEQRLGNRQNAFVAAKLRYLEPAQPWLDEDLVDFLYAIPGTMRAQKRITKKMLQTAHSDLANVPFAQQDSIPHARTYRNIIPARPMLADFIRDQFHDALDPRIAVLFRQDSLLNLVDSMLTGAPYPFSSAHWWSRLPGMWRIDAKRYATDRIHPVSIMLRLMQLNIYLRAMDRHEPESAYPRNC
jgi:hypothetical protein